MQIEWITWHDGRRMGCSVSVHDTQGFAAEHCTRSCGGARTHFRGHRPPPDRESFAWLWTRVLWDAAHWSRRAFLGRSLPSRCSRTVAIDCRRIRWADGHNPEQIPERWTTRRSIRGHHATLKTTQRIRHDLAECVRVGGGSHNHFWEASYGFARNQFDQFENGHMTGRAESTCERARSNMMNVGQVVALRRQFGRPSESIEHRTTTFVVIVIRFPS